MKNVWNMVCAHALECETQMLRCTKALPLILIESSPFLFHVVLCGPHSGLWNCFICDFCALASQQLLPWKSCAFQSKDILVDFTTMLFIARLILHISSVKPFSILTAIILHISILPLSPSSPYLPSSCLYSAIVQVCVRCKSLWVKSKHLHLTPAESLLHLLKWKAERLWPRLSFSVKL